MTIKILTLFPKMFDVFDESIIGRAKRNGIIDIEAVDIRKFSNDKKHFKCDDAPYGGGAGMVMTPQPIYDCIQATDPNHEYLRIFMSPQGRKFCDAAARELAGHDKLLILCGHYEGVDRRVIELCIDMEISIGDYILSGGEIAAMAVVDATARFVDGVLGSSVSHETESFSDGLLEYHQYTRPAEFMGLRVPDVLLNGDHKAIDKYRSENSKAITRERRSDLLNGDGE